mgnify:CR=1 FL=1
MSHRKRGVLLTTLLTLVAVILTFVGFAYIALGLAERDQVGFTSSREALTQRPTSKKARNKNRQPVRRNPYRATSIVNESNSCAAVRSLLNVKFLDVDKKIPSLPVPGCNLGHCNCKYVHHEDRREDDGDRRAPISLGSALYEHSGDEDRRSSRGGRRKRDLDRRVIQYDEFVSKY